MDLERRTDGTGEQRDGRILDDDRVRPGRRDAPDELFDDRQLGLEHEGVERDVDARAGAMHPRDDLGEPRGRKVLGPGARVEAVVETEVDRVGAGGERRGEGVVVARGCEDLRTARHRGAVVVENLSGSVP